MPTKHGCNRSRWGIVGVWIGLGLVSGCSREAELRPVYRFEGRVLIAGTERGPGQSLSLLVCAAAPLNGTDTLVRIPTNDSGEFRQVLSSDLQPHQLRLVMDSLPPDFIQPPGMPAVSGYAMTNLRIQVPARAWLRMHLDLTSMLPGGLLSLVVGAYSELFYNPVQAVRTVPWVGGLPLSVQGSYTSGPGATPRPLDTLMVLEPLRVTEWFWTPH
jgi:hypothetical protein